MNTIVTRGFGRMHQVLTRGYGAGDLFRHGGGRLFGSTKETIDKEISLKFKTNLQICKKIAISYKSSIEKDNLVTLSFKSRHEIKNETNINFKARFNINVVKSYDFTVGKDNRKLINILKTL